MPRRGAFDKQGRLVLKNLCMKELEEWASSVGETANRALQLWRWMYADGCWISDMQQTFGVQNGFSQKFIDKCAPHATLSGGLQLQQVRVGLDVRKEGEKRRSKCSRAQRSGLQGLLPPLPPSSRNTPLQVARSKDGTRKLVFKLTEGEAAGGIVETVLIPVVREAGLRNRITICVSSQVGCAMNCQVGHRNANTGLPPCR
jgi:adenine C2-methylase RlmN of 23S rRNA A2503 and tRNA A37